jgi:hypothetical protein
VGFALPAEHRQGRRAFCRRGQALRPSRAPRRRTNTVLSATKRSPGPTSRSRHDRGNGRPDAAGSNLPSWSAVISSTESAITSVLASVLHS